MSQSEGELTFAAVAAILTLLHGREPEPAESAPVESRIDGVALTREASAPGWERIKFQFYRETGGR